MATPDELRADLAEGRKVLREALAAASSGWERKPAGGEGEAAWSARETAEHVIPAEAHFTTLVCTACGYPGVEFDPRPSYATTDDAIKAFDEMVERCNKKLKYVTEGDLEKSHEGWTSAHFMVAAANHVRDHATQIRAAAGVSL